METLTFEQSFLRDVLWRGSNYLADEVSQIMRYWGYVGANAAPGRMSLGTSDASLVVTNFGSSFYAIAAAVGNDSDIPHRFA